MARPVLFRAAVAAILASLASAPPARATETTDKALSQLGTGPLTFLHYLLYGGLLDIMGGDDPALAGGVARHRNWSATVNGAPTTFTGSRSTFFSGFLWGNYDVGPHLGLPANQQLVVGGFYRHSRARTDIGADGRSDSHGHAIGGLLSYGIDAAYVTVAGGYEWGGGTLTSLPSNATGSFATSGHSFGFAAGHVFTLWGDRAGIHRDNPWPHNVRQVSVYFDPSFRAVYARSGSDAFTNSRGTPFGAQDERSWTLGGSFRLSVVVPQGNGMVVRPHIAFTIDRQVDYRHTLALPATGQTARLDHDRTAWGVNGGVTLWFDRHLSIGVEGFHRASASHDASGAMAWLRVNLFGPGGYIAQSRAGR